MSQIRLREVDEELHMALKIESIKQRMTLENIIKKLLVEKLEEINGK